jgi:hypothetical protein
LRLRLWGLKAEPERHAELPLLLQRRAAAIALRLLLVELVLAADGHQLT